MYALAQRIVGTPKIKTSMIQTVYIQFTGGLIADVKYGRADYIYRYYCQSCSYLTNDSSNYYRHLQKPTHIVKTLGYVHKFDIF